MERKEESRNLDDGIINNTDWEQVARIALEAQRKAQQKFRTYAQNEAYILKELFDKEDTD